MESSSTLSCPSVFFVRRPSKSMKASEWMTAVGGAAGVSSQSRVDDGSTRGGEKCITDAYLRGAQSLTLASWFLQSPTFFHPFFNV